jgi:hypothetical protein
MKRRCSGSSRRAGSLVAHQLKVRTVPEDEDQDAAATS